MTKPPSITIRQAQRHRNVKQSHESKTALAKSEFDTSALPCTSLLLTH